MAIIITIVVLVLLLSLCIIPHEFGHFIFAKIFGVKVNEFSMGMGPIVVCRADKKWIFPFKKKIDTSNYENTVYSLRLFPIGGFVDLKGENGGEDPDDFQAISKWKRFVILAAGAGMNILVGFIATLILSSTLFYAIPSLQIQSVPENSEYYQGLMAGDIILEIDNKKIKDSNDLSYTLALKKTDTVDFLVKRIEDKILIEDVKLPTVEADGMIAPIFDLPLVGENNDLASSIQYSASSTISSVEMTYSSIGAMIKGDIPLTAMSGFVGIGELISQNLTTGLWGFLFLLSLISINLGIMNMLPVPALDGGHCFFILIEAIRGKKMNQATINILTKICFISLLLFSAVITVKDILFFGK